MAADSLRSKLPTCYASGKASTKVKCRNCGSDVKKFFEENMYVPCKSYFITEDGERISLYVCPKCGRVQGEFYKEHGRVVKYC